MLTRSHRVIRIDLLGYGRSAKPADRSYALPDQARRVGVVMDRLGVERVIVVGHSSGGAAATAFAEQRPDLVAALVLINTGPHMGAYIAPPVAIDPSQWPNVTDEQLRQFASSGFSRPGYQIPLELLNQVRAMTFHSLTTTTQASRDYVKEQALPDRLASLGKPLLVIFGEEDRRWRSSSAADYRAVPGARVEMLPGLGHTPILEDPARVASSLELWLEDLARRLGAGCGTSALVGPATGLPVRPVGCRRPTMGVSMDSSRLYSASRRELGHRVAAEVRHPHMAAVEGDAKREIEAVASGREFLHERAVRRVEFGHRVAAGVGDP